MVLEGDRTVRHEGETMIAAGDVMFIPKGSSIEFAHANVRALSVRRPPAKLAIRMNDFITENVAQSESYAQRRIGDPSAR